MLRPATDQRPRFLTLATGNTLYHRQTRVPTANSIQNKKRLLIIYNLTKELFHF